MNNVRNILLGSSKIQLLGKVMYQTIYYGSVVKDNESNILFISHYMETVVISNNTNGELILKLNPDRDLRSVTILVPSIEVDRFCNSYDEAYSKVKDQCKSYLLIDEVSSFTLPEFPAGSPSSSVI